MAGATARARDQALNELYRDLCAQYLGSLAQSESLSGADDDDDDNDNGDDDSNNAAVDNSDNERPMTMKLFWLQRPAQFTAVRIRCRCSFALTRSCSALVRRL